MKPKAILFGFWMPALILFACSSGVNGVPEPRPHPESSVEEGRRLIASYGCGSCHSVPGVPGADAMAAPPLDCFHERSYIAGKLTNTRDNLVLWIRNPQQIDPGNAMPDLGVTEDEAEDIAAYLYDTPTGWRVAYALERKCSWR